MKNYVVVDFDPCKVSNINEWNKLLMGLKETSHKNWELFGTEIYDTSFHSKERYIHYFKLAWTLFRDRVNISAIVANQQFYGIIFAFFCRLFHVKKTTKDIVVSFIYNKKNGLKGKIYEQFIKYSVQSRYVDKLIVHSESEIDYYSTLLNIPKEKLVFCPLGITDDSEAYQIKRFPLLQESYVLGIGNSNRDFAFMENALAGEEYEVRIFSDKVEKHNNQNVHPITCICMAGNLIVGSVTPLYYVYTLTKRLKFPSLITIFMGFANVIGMYLLLTKTSLGLYAVVLTTAVLNTTIHFFDAPLYSATCLNVKLRTFYPEIIKHLFSCLITTISLCLLVKTLPVATSWSMLVLVAIPCVIVGCFMAAVTTFTRNEIKYFLKKIVK